MALESSISRRYATALIDFAGSGGDAAIDRAAEEVARFAQLFDSSSDVANVLTNPIFTPAERSKTLDALMEKLQLSDATRRFLTLILERGRMAATPQIARTVRKLADDRARRVRAIVETAAPLSPDAADSLRRALEKRTGKRVEIDVAVNPSLLGGVRARIGSTVLDGTIRSQLELLRETLARSD
jgi:F-type H+-transporting ATPase subunit delta